LRAWEYVLEAVWAPKEPEITQTSPSGQKEDHEKYSSLASAAIKTS